MATETDSAEMKMLATVFSGNNTPAEAEAQPSKLPMETV